MLQRILFRQSPTLLATGFPRSISSRIATRSIHPSALLGTYTVCGTHLLNLLPHSRLQIHCEARHHSFLAPPVPFTAKPLAAQTVGNEPTEIPFSQLLRSVLCTISDWILLGAVACTAVAAAVVNLYTPRFIGRLVNLLSDYLRATSAIATATTSGSSSLSLMQALRAPALSLLSLFAGQGALTFVYIYLVAILGERAASRLRCKLYRSLIEQDMAFHDSNRSGELVSRLTNDISEFKHAFKQTISQGLKSVSQVVGSAIQLFQLSSRLTGALLLTTPLLYGCGNFYGAFLRFLSAKAKAKEGQAAAIASEALSNIKTVRSFASENSEVDRYQQAIQEASESNERLAFHIGVFQGFTNFSIGSMVLTVLYFGGRMVASGEMSGGDLMTYLISVQGAQKSLALVGVLFAQTIKSISAFGRIQEFMDRKPAIPVRGGRQVDRQFIQSADIEFRDVTFAYPSRPDQLVLDRFSLRIPRGKVVALCGASGSGKSTVAALLERFYDVENKDGEGGIVIDGQPIHAFDPSSLRQSIGFINQEPVLFGTSILENVRYARPEASVDQVRDCLRMANADSFVDQFPQGLETMVGERGAMLSGGQKQRISIARALLKQPAVLILDEATSALDAHSEALVQEALDRAMKGLTVLIIAHRLSTIQKADIIVLMGRGGKIIEQGTHDELMAKQGPYYDLYKTSKSPDFLSQ